MLKKINDFLAGIPMTIVGGVFLAVSLALSLTDHKAPIDPAWVAVIICGIPLLYLSVWRIIHNHGISKISSALLISIAMIAAIAIGDLFAAGEVAFIMSIGAILEDKTTERAKKGLKELISLTPRQGRRIVNGKEEMIAAEEIKMEDVLRVLPGETIPVDGDIIEGTTSVDQSIMTGESLPVDKAVGDSVFCGTINRFGTIEIRASKLGEDSSLQKLIRMVEEAENKKAPMARIADKAASWLVPVALLIAIAAWIVTKDIVRAVTVLVVFCPCALVLATPTAIMAAIGQATKHGVIIKSGEALERMGQVDTVAFDKTGTLTNGNLVVKDIYPFDREADRSLLLRLTASAESYSEHPLAKAITAYAKEENVELLEVEDFHMIPGKGISAVVRGERLFCGNGAFLKEQGIEGNSGAEQVLERFRSQGKAVILIADAEKLLGAVTLSDTLRDASASMTERLRNIGTHAVLLTGDHRQTAVYFAEQVGIADVRAELLPEQKVSEIAALQKAGRTVCMIGDGVNDAPALKTADVSVAMGAMGSDIAVEAADIALMSDDIAKIPYLKRLSNACVKTIRFSISLSLFINFVAIALSLSGLLTPTTGALVHNCGSCFVVLIAALLYDRKFE
ncbi:MAG: cation-translocating P-type ATPase [Lachnospiraceae bacterium]|nr:cation-translocating P-type ATPase [Lachnospiraceae bacterium]